MSIRISATKTNLLRTKKTLSLCREGHQLLDEKRKILLMEISSLTIIIEKIQKDVDDSIEKAYRAVEKALVSMGKNKLEQIAAGIDIQVQIELSERKVMGATLPQVSLSIKENPPFFSPVGISPHVDEAIILMKEALKNIALLAEKKISLMRLEQEFLRATKKVNALEKIHIPYYSEIVKFIADRLDEESREAFATLKEIKKKIVSRES